PQTGKGPSRNAETAKRLTGKALALSSAANILRSQTGVFQQNRLVPDLRCAAGPSAWSPLARRCSRPRADLRAKRSG
ncbi:hypothetical protein, partial [Rhodovulum sulfidophilum]|uniref:hypothetical protein n=1 Tax=Rhodovulum sulfidophilum TaxID=35806 RepID=UPI001F2733C5